jgi:hypothetical protein
VILMAFRPYRRAESGADMCAVVLETFIEIHMAQKEAALLAEIDQATLTRALQGKTALDLHWLAAWGAASPKFSLVFVPKFVAAVLSAWCRNVSRDVAERRSA